MVFRCYATKKSGFDVEAASLLRDLKDNLGLAGLESVRIYNRYDVEGVDEEVFKRGMDSVFSEPPCDLCYAESMPEPPAGARVLISEALPGQYDQRADSCAQCLQLMTCAERPAVAYAKVFVFEGKITDEEFARVTAWLINPVDSRVASADKPETIIRNYPSAPPVANVEGFLAADDKKLAEILDSFGLAMDMDDLRFMQRHYIDEVRREPTVTELKVINTYWSDHCRHTTFSTHLDDVRIEDAETKAAFEQYLAARREVYGEKAETRPVTLMDVATIGAKALKKRGLLKELDVSDEINACSIHVDAKIDGKTEDWLLMFKNETHNHPTEIEPFGGAATCIGGAIRDPLSGRSYVYQAMRITGAADPTVPVSETIKGKLPQRKLTTSAAAGYSSYGNQIGLATG
ncbi:MAG: phosphoribosylformylglycinamidine synthase, partial [Oscillospiraceae bacterium]|nr:phosphoribosylformylglycinamidine synthase [Oscillospiraceae bacterium]